LLTLAFLSVLVPARAADTLVENEELSRAQLKLQSILEMIRTRRLPVIEFNFASAELRPSSYASLDKIAAILYNRPNLKLIVEGHCDDRGSDEYNDLLSRRRAESIKSYLVSRGLEPDNIRAYGYGKRRPVTADISERGRQLNRRVEFILTNRGWDSVF